MSVFSIGPRPIESPEALLSQRQHLTKLHQLLNQLPPLEHQLLSMLYIADLSRRDAAERLSMTPMQVSRLRHKALHNLRLAWQRANPSYTALASVPHRRSAPNTFTQAAQ